MLVNGVFAYGYVCQILLTNYKQFGNTPMSNSSLLIVTIVLLFSILIFFFALYTLIVSEVVFVIFFRFSSISNSIHGR